MTDKPASPGVVAAVLLLSEVRLIEFDVCASEATARDREEQLVCTLLPRFNRAGKVWPR